MNEGGGGSKILKILRTSFNYRPTGGNQLQGNNPWCFQIPKMYVYMTLKNSHVPWGWVNAPCNFAFWFRTKFRGSLSLAIFASSNCKLLLLAKDSELTQPGAHSYAKFWPSSLDRGPIAMNLFEERVVTQKKGQTKTRKGAWQDKSLILNTGQKDSSCSQWIAARRHLFERLAATIKSIHPFIYSTAQISPNDQLTTMASAQVKWMSG